MAELLEPQTREEQFLKAAATGDTSQMPTPISRVEMFLAYIAENGGGGGGGGGSESTIAWRPSVSADGTISWTRTSSTATPAPVNVKGEKGDTGATGATGEKGETGEKGADGAKGDKGDDGYSPTITVTEITGGHRVTVTDADGSESFDVMDGQGGGGTSDFNDLTNRPKYLGDAMTNKTDVKGFELIEDHDGCYWYDDAYTWMGAWKKTPSGGATGHGMVVSRGQREIGLIKGDAGSSSSQRWRIPMADKVEDMLAEKADKATTYTKVETDGKIAEAMTDVDNEHFHPVTVLPNPADEDPTKRPKENHEYILIEYEQDGTTIKSETHYLFYGGAYHQKPTGGISLDGYATEDFVNTKTAKMGEFDVATIPQGPTSAHEINAVLSNKDNEYAGLSYVRQSDGALPNTVRMNVKSGLGEDSFDLPTKAYVNSKALSPTGWGVARTGVATVEFNSGKWSTSATVDVSDLGFSSGADYDVVAQPTTGGTAAPWGNAIAFVNANKGASSFSVSAVTMEETLSGTVNVKYTIFAKGYGAVAYTGEIPTGGATGQVLAKRSDADGDYGWVTGGGGTVDTAMSDTSENAVQNKVVKAYVDNIQGLPSGGTNGQILARNSMSPENAEWIDNPIGTHFEIGAEKWYGTYTEDGVTYQVYSKLLNIGALPSAAGATQYPHGISGIKQILQISGFTNDGFVMNAPRQNAQDNISIYQAQKAGNIVVEVGKDRSGKTGFVMMIYAKNN